MPVSRMILAWLALLAAPGFLRAQGGPPMITDDPGTPGDRHWEINLAWTCQKADGSTLTGLPLLDANYGVGDRIQLNYQASYNLERADGESPHDGASGSQFALKWRFYDAGETGLQVSMYPRLTLPVPHPDASDSRGPDAQASFLAPLEVARDFGAFSVNLDFGHTFCADAGGRGWMGGVCVGHNLVKGWEIDAEVHVAASERLGARETVLDFGTRYDFNEHATLLVAAGRDLSNTLSPRVSALTYLGIQLRL